MFNQRLTCANYGIDVTCYEQDAGHTINKFFMR